MTTPTNTLARDAVFLYLSVGRLRTRRKLDSGAVTSDIDPALIHISKDIIESPELDAVQVADNELRSWVRARCLPSPFKGKGIMILPVRLVQQVMDKIDEAKTARLPLIEAFMATYAQRKAEAMPKLASGFNEADYPPDEAVRNAFSFSAQIWELSAPGQLAAISRDLYQRELIKLDNMWAEASQQISAVLLQEFKKLTSHLSEKLQPGVDGKAKTFRNTTVTKLTEWLALFSARNLTTDEELVTLINKARGLIQGVDPENIRDSEALRKDLATAFQEITKEVDEQIINRPVRAIELEEA